MADSRKRILEQLQRHGSMSVGELSRALGLTSVTIRHHLVSLLEEELVKAARQRRRPGPGRPELSYELTPLGKQALPRNFSELGICLVELLARSLPPPELEAILRSAGQRLGDKERVSAAARPRTPVADLLAFLTARGYLPEISREGPAYHLTFAHCPYLELAVVNPRVCAFDHALLEALVEGKVEVQGRIVEQESRCVLTVRSPLL